MLIVLFLPLSPDLCHSWEVKEPWQGCAEVCQPGRRGARVYGRDGSRHGHPQRQLGHPVRPAFISHIICTQV